MLPTPVSLLEQLRQPSPLLAWPRFVDLYAPVLHRWARQLDLQEADAADLVQDVFSILLKKLPDFRYDSRLKFRAWLKTVAVNRWREVQRRLRPTPIGASPEPPQGVPDPAEQFWEADYRRYLVDRALEIMHREFEPKTWQACWAVVVEEEPAVQVAARLGMSVGAVYVARSRVLARLRLELKGLLE